jgi:transcriptional regulator with XRE-family HTH domain
MSEIPQFPLSSSAEFARRFRLLMSWHDFTLRDIAVSTHNAISTVGTWRNGRLPNSPETIHRLAQTFQVPVDYLLTGQLSDSGDESNTVVDRILHDLDWLNRALDRSHPYQQARKK